MTKCEQGRVVGRLYEMTTDTGTVYFSGVMGDKLLLLMQSGEIWYGRPMWHLVVDDNLRAIVEDFEGLFFDIIPFSDFTPGAYVKCAKTWETT